MTKLTQLATQMRQTIDHTGAAYCHHKLGRGLELVLQRTGRGYRLALGRTDTAPSDTEIETCIAAFNVPGRRRTAPRRQNSPGQNRQTHLPRRRTHLDRTGATPCRVNSK